jgi:hypothetical protein
MFRESIFFQRFNACILQVFMVDGYCGLPKPLCDWGSSISLDIDLFVLVLYHGMINDNGRKHIVPLVAMDTAEEIEEDFLKFDFYLILFCIVFIILVVDFLNIICKMHLCLLKKIIKISYLIYVKIPNIFSYEK